MSNFETLILEVRQCKVCLPYLVHGVNPVFSAHTDSKIAIIGQAPGSIVHKNGIPWDDRSGDRLRSWLGVSRETFYNPVNFSLIPMGFCYPGKGKSGDLPPRSECAPLWHARLFQELQKLELILLIGSYAQSYYLGDLKKQTLTQTVRCFKKYLPKFLPLPHPSPRNNIWIRKNPWFEEDLLPELKKRVVEVQLE